MKRRTISLFRLSSTLSRCARAFAVTRAVSEICERLCVLFSASLGEMRVSRRGKPAPRWVSSSGIRLSRRRAGARWRRDDPLCMYFRAETRIAFTSALQTTLCKYVSLCETRKFATLKGRSESRSHVACIVPCATILETILESSTSLRAIN